MSKRRCPQCGAPLPADSPEGLCPQCLLKFGLASGPSVGDDEEPTAPPPRPKKDPAVGQQIGPYRIVQLLGEGGMGMVYLAQQEQPIRRRVALKIIKLGMDTREVIARFESERQALAMMDHPNIAKVFDAGASDQGRPFFAMEYVPGIPITDYCDKHRLSNRERLVLFTQICQAIQHAHQKGIIHRDIKPSNVLVSIQDGKPVPKIIDFGVAKATNQRLTEKTLFTEQGLLIGTPEYMSPEQAEMTGLDVDTTTDIYSLGVLLYELLVGALPFDPQMLRRAGYDEIRRIIREEEPPKPTTRLHTLGAKALEVAKQRHTDVASLQKQLRGDMDWITMKAMEKDRTHRYASASEFAADIARHLNDEPVTASPPGAMYRIRKFVKKNKGPVVAVCAVLVVLMVGLSVSTVMYFTAQRARNQAEQQRAVAERRGYAANLSAADLHLRSYQVAEAKRRLLACEPALHNWEWWHLYFKSDSSLATLYAHGRFSRFPFLPSSFAFSPDGTRMFWNTQHTLHAWDTVTNLPIATYGGFGSILAISPDLTRIVAKGFKGSEKDLSVIDPLSGKLFAKLVGHLAEVDCARFSPDGKRIVSGSQDNTVRVWETASGKLLATLKGHKLWVHGVAFSPDGKHIASVGGDRTLIVWDAQSGRKIHMLKGHEREVNSVAFSPDGTKIVSGGGDNTVRIWDASSGRAIFKLTGHAGRIYCVAFNPTGTRIVSGSEDKTVRTWDVSSGQSVAVLIGHNSYVISAAYNPSGTRIVSADLGNQEIRVWDTNTNAGTTIIKAPQERFASVAFSRDGTRIVSRSFEENIHVWDARSGKLISSMRGHEGEVNRPAHFDARRATTFDADTQIGSSVSYSPDGARIASASSDNSVRVWNASGASLLTLKGHMDQVNSVAFSPDGTRIVSGSSDKTIRVWDATSGAALLTLILRDRVNSVVVSPDGTRILSGSGAIRTYPAQDASVNVWDLASGRLLVKMEWEQDPPAVNSVAFSPDGRRVISHWDRTVRVWDAFSGKPVATLEGHDTYINSVAFSPDGTRIISGSVDEVRVWDALRYETLLSLRGGAEGVVTFFGSVTFSPEGGLIAAVLFSQNRVCVWETRSAYVPEALPLVSSLFKKLIFAADVIRRLQTDEALEERLRRAALQIARGKGDDPHGLNRASWEIVRSPSRQTEDYRLALRQAELASRLAPWEWSSGSVANDGMYFLRTVGIAQYRLGAYQEALKTLTRLQGAPDVAFIAMSHYQLGQADKAKAGLERVRAMMQDPRRSSDNELQGFLREAEALIGRSTGAPEGKKK